MRRVTSDLLRLKHGLTDEQIAKAVLCIEFELVTDTVSQQKPSSLTSLPGVFWSSDGRSHSLQYA